MSELNPTHGIITASCEVACDKCGVFFLGLKYPFSAAVVELRENGWEKVNQRWQCRQCVEQQKGSPDDERNQ